MKVIRAEVLGFCFGVRDALATARQTEHPERVTILGQLVHNEAVLVEMDGRGFRQTGEQDIGQMPTTKDVLITAHGISDARRGRLSAAGKRLIDTTCPLVRSVHEAACRLASEGRHVIVIGRPGHVEVLGLIEDLPSYTILARAADVQRYPHQRLGIVCQSTTPPHVADQIHRAVRAANSQADIQFENTICGPTRDRQQAVGRLMTKVDVVVVVGGRNSNNTRQLVQLCRQHGRRAYQVQTAADLKRDWFARCRTVGLTAGTSSLDGTIDEVERALCQMGQVAPTLDKCASEQGSTDEH